LKDDMPNHDDGMNIILFYTPREIWLESVWHVVY